MIRRKCSLGYIEFIRGRYNVDDVEHIESLFHQMITTEIKDISENTFDRLWNKLWKSNAKSKSYEAEYISSKKKFIKLKNTSKYNLSYFCDFIKPYYNTPEWGFPKGRRNFYEKNIECAKREFAEETNLNNNEYILFDNIITLNEIFKGTNNIPYKHIYYIGTCDKTKDVGLNNQNIHQSLEIGDIGWFTYNEAINLIRPYHTERKKILNELYLYIVDCIVKSWINKKETISIKNKQVFYNEVKKITTKKKRKKIKNI